MADAPSPEKVPPAKSTQHNTSETPRINRNDGARTPITQLRAQIANEMDQEFVECSFDDFMTTYMPFIPTDANVDSCIQAMLTESLMERHDDEFEFKGFNERTSKNTTEAIYFKPLERIAAVIGKCTIENLQCNYPYKDLHTRTIASGIDGSTNKCDGYFKAGDSEDLSATFIAVPCELKVSSLGPKKCDVVSANVQIMNADLRRMFTFGLTIEGDYMTLWYLSRSHSAVSKPKNYVKNPQSLIKVFMSFMFASSDKMGYDPQVTLNKDGSYTYAIPPADPESDNPESDEPSRFFRTVKPISEYRSNNITGRMARIWLVAEVASVSAPILKKSPKYVLKDVWLEEDAKTEQEIQREIFKDIEKFLNNKKLSPAEAALQPLHDTHFSLLKDKQYQKYFLTIEAGSVGEHSTRVVAGGTRARNLFVDREKLPSLAMSTSAKLFQSRQTGTTSRQSSGTPRPVEPEQKQDIDRQFVRRKRYFVVFKEVCEAVGDLTTLGEVVDIVAQALIPLQLMFCAGWVHRDISSGNILAHKVGKRDLWKVKLSDLEYAKRFPPVEGSAAHVDPKTGTPYFMPHEILAEDYVYNDVDDLKHKIELRRARHKAVLAGAPKSVTSSGPPNVVHNFQHDLESLWWLLLWTLTSRVPYEDSKTYGKTIFQNSIQLSTGRRRAFTKSIAEDLSTKLCPEASHFAETMEIMRGDLYVNAFERKEENLNQPKSYVGIHRLIQETLSDVVQVKDQPWARIELDSHSAYLNAPDPTAESDSVVPPSDTQKITPSAAPLRLSKRLAESSSNKRARDAPEYISSEEDEDTADNKASSSSRGTGKKASRSSKRSRS